MPKQSKKKFQDLDKEEQKRIRVLIQERLDEFVTDVGEATGYFIDANFDLYADELSKSLEVSVPMALLVRPHEYDERRVRHYIKVNPNNCLNEKIVVYNYGSWYEIFNGVHRTEANRRLGKKTIVADIIIPREKDKNDLFEYKKEV